MTLEGAINLNETNDYIIYTMNSVTTGQYGVVVPKNINGTLKMLVDLHMKGSFDGVGNGTKTKEQLVEEIASEYSKLKTKYVDGMLVMPMIDENVFQNTVLTGDKQKMFDEVKKIGAITSELYKKLTDSGIDKQKIDQKIIVVEKTGEDEKFVAWLKEQMPNFVDGLPYNQLSITGEAVNPFTASNDIFGTSAPQTEVSALKTPVDSAPISSGGIFDNVAPVAPVSPSVETVTTNIASEPVTASTPVESVVTTANVVEPVPSIDVFGIPTNVQGAEVAQTSVPVEPVVNQNTVVTETPVAPVSPVVANPTTPVTPVVEGPKPVESAMLEGTIAFTPIPNHPNNPTNEQSEVVGDGNETTNKGNKGFVNLAILLVVLIGVTLISVELGKYLYSVYGA